MKNAEYFYDKLEEVESLEDALKLKEEIRKFMEADAPDSEKRIVRSRGECLAMLIRSYKMK